MEYEDCKERLILVQQSNWMAIQNEYYVVVAKDEYEVGETFDRESLFHFTNMPVKKLSKKGKLIYAIKHLQEYKDEPLLESQYEEDVWDNELKNRFADSLIEPLEKMLQEYKS